jgi:Divergent InlB B-repeat domain
MQSSLRRTSFAVVASFGLSLFAAACAVDPVIYAGPDASAPPGTATLTVARNGTSTGVVASNPGGISCGAACSAALPLGTMVTLTATPDPGAEFAGWHGGGCAGTTPTCQVTIAAAATVTATFDLARYLVTIDLGGSGTGMVVAPSAGITCPGTCSGMVPYGSQLSLTAAPGASSQFMGWTVGTGATACTGTATCSTTITGPTTITATFARDQSLEITRSGTGTGTVTSNPAGINCGADCSEIYPPGTAVALTATAAADSTFVGWSGGGCSGTGMCNVVVNGAVMVTADFALRRYDLTVTRTGAGAGSVTSTPAGIDCGATCTASYDTGTQVTLSAAAAAGSLFAGWSGGACTGTTTCVVTVAAAVNVTATFTLNTYALSITKAGTGAGTVISSPAGINCGTTCAATFNHGTAVTLTATPLAGSTFTGWSGAGCTGTGACSVTVTSATTVTATFAIVTYPVTVALAGTGTGSVTSSPAGIECGFDCSETVNHGTVMTLTATAAVGSTFTGWSGDCTGPGVCSVTVTSPKSVTAIFTRNTYALSVTRSGTGSGSVTSSPSGIDCGATCSEVVGHGSNVTLTAVAATGSTFTGWSGGGCSGTSPCTMTVTAATTVNASFTLNRYTLSVALGGTGSGSVTSSPAGISCGSTCSELVDHGGVVRLTAAAAVGSTFAGWSGGGCASANPCDVTMTAATSVSATFTLNTYPLTVEVDDGASATDPAAGAIPAATTAGTVTSSPAGINCDISGAGCSEVVDHGTVVTLTATPAAGWRFSSWSGVAGCTGTGTCRVTMLAPTTVFAQFLRVSSCGDGRCDGAFENCTNCPRDCGTCPPCSTGSANCPAPLPIRDRESADSEGDQRR